MQDQCLEINYKETYLGETARRLRERDLNHAGKGRESNLVKHSMNTDHPTVYMKNVQILTKGFNHCKFKKICEALLIKEHRPTLNAQEQSVF